MIRVCNGLWAPLTCPAEAGIDPMGKGSVQVKVPDVVKCRSRISQPGRKMSSPWNTVPLLWNGIMRLLWISIVLCMVSCTAPDRPLSTPSGLSQGGQPGRTERPALDRLLSRGEVHVAEAHLQDLGYNPGPVDGIFTGETQAAVRAFQARYGIPVSGLLDRKTRLELLPGLDQHEFEP